MASINRLGDISLPESAAVAVVGREGVIFSCGGVVVDDIVKFHSAAKPMQCLRFLREDYANPYGLTDGERAMLASSHWAQEIHVGLLESIMRKAGICEERLIVPSSMPFGGLAKEIWAKRGITERKLFHQCAGNHMGYILRAKELGADESRYHLLDTPMQQEALGCVERFVGRSGIETTPDNCGVPTYRVSLAEVATAYLGFILEEPFAADLLRRNAVCVEGDGAIATELMRAYPVVAKSAVNKMVAIGHIQAEAGIAIKADDWGALGTLAEAVLVAMSRVG